MELIQWFLEVITASAPRIIAIILLQFSLFWCDPYKNTKLLYCRLKRRKIDGVVVLGILYFLFALFLGVPSTARKENFLNITFDIGNRKFTSVLLYFVIFVFVQTIVTIYITMLIRYAFGLRGRAKAEFLELFLIFLAFTIGWFLLISIALGTRWRQFVPFWLLFELDELYYSHESIIWTNTWRILATPASIIILYATFRFGNALLGKWKVQGQYIGIPITRRGTVVWEVSGRIVPFFVVLMLLGESALLVSALDHLLFPNVEKEAAARSAQCFIRTIDAAKKTRVLSVNWSVVNKSEEEQLLNPVEVLVQERANEKNGFVLRIRPSEILWLSDRGGILEGNEIRYFRINVGLEPQYGGLRIDPSDSLKCTVLNGGENTEETTRKNYPGRGNDKVEYQHDAFLVIEGRNVNGDSMSAFATETGGNGKE